MRARLFAFLLLLAPLFAQAETFVLNHRASNAPMRITKVEQTASATRVFVRYRETEEISNIGLYPPGHRNSMQLASLDGRVVLPVRQIVGFPLRPHAARDVSRGEVIEFELVFAPSSLRAFNLYEANPQHSQDEEFWRFDRVVLR